jgi:hypothetical protein
MIVWQVLKWVRCGADLAHPTAQVKTGFVTRYWRRGNKHTSYWLKIANVATAIPKSAYEMLALFQNEPFIVYCTPRANFFLSCEPAAWATFSLETILNQSHAASEI